MAGTFVVLVFLALGAYSCSDLGTVAPGENDGTRVTDGVFFIGAIPGFPTSLRLEDSLGHATTNVRAEDPLWLRYAALNRTGRTMTWSTAMAYPFARFLVKQGIDTVADSFSGMAFAAVVLNGVLYNGDSLTTRWRLDPAKYPLSPGSYTAVAVPTYVLGRTDIPDSKNAVFSIIP